jgi:hypothetical protein
VYLDNEISGQTDTHGATLPKGGIALNGAAQVTVRGGSIRDCAADGIFWISPSAAASDAQVLIDGVAIEACRASGVELQSAVRDSRNVEVRRCTIRDCGVGVLLKTFPAVTITDVRIESNDIRSALPASVGVQVASDDGSLRVAELSVRGGAIATRGSGIIAARVTTGPVRIGGGLRLEGPFADSGLNVAGTTQLDVDGVVFSGQTSGHALRTTGARGTLRGVAFSGDSDPARRIENSGGEDLGRAPPRWTPASGGAVVQDILATVPGGSGSRGWIHDPVAGWRETRIDGPR